MALSARQFTMMRNTADRYMRQELFEQAREIYVTLTEENPEDEGLYKSLGDVCCALHDFDHAIQAYQTAIDLDPQHAGMYYLLGECYSAKNEQARAIEFYDQALTIKADDKVIIEARKVSQDILDLHKQLEATPDDMIARLDLGMLYMKKRIFPIAKENFEKVLRAYPQHAEGNLRLGQVAYELKDYTTALSLFEKAHDLNPAKGEILYLLGLVYDRLEMWKEAISCWTKFIETNPTHLFVDRTKQHIRLTHRKQDLG